MNNDKENIEIPLGAFDSELGGWQYTIPAGFEAAIENGKVIIRKSESEDEWMVNFIKKQLFNIKKTITENYELDAKLTKAIDWLERQGEQKPEWSDADENTLLDTINTLRSCGRCSTDRALWLMSLKNRILPQTKTEWSKEDERNRQEAIRILSDAADSYTEGSGGYAPSWAKCIPWLKSLRPQNHWKPSEEQMKALDEYIYAKEPNTQKYAKAVLSLYHDLKAL